MRARARPPSTTTDPAPAPGKAAIAARVSRPSRAHSQAARRRRSSAPLRPRRARLVVEERNRQPVVVELPGDFVDAQHRSILAAATLWNSRRCFTGGPGDQESPGLRPGCGERSALISATATPVEFAALIYRRARRSGESWVAARMLRALRLNSATANPLEFVAVLYRRARRSGVFWVAARMRRALRSIQRQPPAGIRRGAFTGGPGDQEVSSWKASRRIVS